MTQSTPNPHPYWGRALQYQQQGQQGGGQRNQGRQPNRQQQPRPTVKEGFDPDILGKDVELEQMKGQNVVVIRGKVEDVSKYWLKLLVNGETLYLNKAFIISIKPLVIKSGGVVANAGK
jgi:hypothetical protein